MMQLVSADASPFARKVRALILETGQQADVEIVTAGPTTPIEPAAEVRAANPLSKIPALIRPGAPTLYDSRVITRFLDARAGSGLYPAAPALWDTLVLEATADGIMEAAVLMVYEGRCRPPDKQDQGWVEAQWSKVEGALDALEQQWLDHLSGPLDMGQIAVGCALGYLDFRHDAREWRKGRGGLDDWFAAFSERPAMRETSPA